MSGNEEAVREVVGVGLFNAIRRRKGKEGQGTLRKSSSADVDHLDEWASARRGVEAYVEPRTNVTETTVVLIAHDGEWTRRRIDSLEAAQKFGSKRSIPVYEATKVGYPQRMRDYTERQRIRKRRQEADDS